MVLLLCENYELNGDIFISIERCTDNASLIIEVTFLSKIKKSLSMASLHYCGYKDKTDAETLLMRNKERQKNRYMFHWNSKTSSSYFIVYVSTIYIIILLVPIRAY
jgi:ssRNA-specific RNase YbeY (16S rRNA maturation enzyme)